MLGGNYALLNLTSPDDISPNPDLYTAVLWRHIMGDAVLNAWASDDRDSGDSYNKNNKNNNEAEAATTTGWALGGNGTQGSLRTYAHCANRSSSSSSSSGAVAFPSPLPPGAVAVLLLNLDNESHAGRRIDLRVDDSDAALATARRGGDASGADRSSLRYEWRLTVPPAASGGVSSHETWLNGALLSLDPATGKLPLPLQPLTAGDASLWLAPLSATFVVLPNAGAAACM